METFSLRSYTDFEIWVGAQTGLGRGQYPVQVVISPDGYGNAIMDLDITAEEFQADLARVRGRESNLALRQRFGKRLFDALFANEVRDRWKGSIGRVKGSSKVIGLRLLLKILDADLAVLPWELLYDQQAGGFLGATANQTVARFLPMAEPKGFQSSDVLRVLFIIQSPQPGLSEKLPPIPEAEIAVLEQAMSRLAAKGVVYKVLKNASTATIFEALQSEEYHVLHYLGHGGAGELYLVAESEQPFSIIDDVSFAHFFLGRASVRLVVLNACSSSQVEGAGLFSGIGPALVNVGVPAVIAMQYEAVYTDTASLYSERFYASLASGLPVDVAVNEARQYLSSKHLADRDWSTPVLYMGTRAGQVLALPGAKVDAAFEPERLIALVNKVMAQLQAAGQHYAELERRSKRLREWLDVQVRIAAARSNADRLNGYVQEAIKLVNKPNRTEADLERGRIRLESVTDQWENDCRQDLTDLTQLLQGCTAITQPDQPTNAPAKSSIVGWATALGAAYQNSDTLFSQDMTAIDNDALKTTCSALDNQGRQLRDWLRDRDNDCRNRLISEATELVSYTTRLGHPEA